MEKSKKEKEPIESIFEGFVLLFGLMFIGELAGGLLIGLIEGIFNITDPSIKLLLENYGVTIGEFIAAIIYARKMGIIHMWRYKYKYNSIVKFLIGLLIGGVMNALCILIAYLHNDLAFSLNLVNVLPFVLAFVLVLIQSSSEEMLFRGIYYQKLKNDKCSKAIILATTSIAFSLVHAFNPGVTITALIAIGLIGLLEALIIYYYDSMWCAMAIHTAWNFTQNFIFGLPNSGLVSPYSIFKLESASNSFAYNISFGVESTIVAIIVTLITIFIIKLINKKKEA